jgi:hypothetical protein
VLIRWMGAFNGSGQSLPEALAWELTQTSREVSACLIPIHARVGIQLRERSFVRGWIQDAWTLAGGPIKDGVLRLTPSRAKKTLYRSWDRYKKGVRTHRTDVYSPHDECACLPPALCGGAVALIVRGHVSHQADMAVQEASQKFGLPILRLPIG